MSEVSSKELYEFKKSLKELAEKKGKGTELVSMYVPPTKQLSDIIKQMRDELGQSANIKSKTTRKNVQSAIEVIMQRIRMITNDNKELPNGFVLFVGMIPKGGPGTEKMETVVIEPPEEIQTYRYICDSTFFLEPLEDMIASKEVYGIAVIDRNEATIATLKGKRINVVANLTSGVPGKHKAGGQSQRRFDRVIDQLAHEFLKRIGSHMDDEFLPIKDDLKGIVLGGPGGTKEDYYNGDYMHYELKDKVITTVDTSYTGEFGIRETIDKASGALEELGVIQEKKLVQRFLAELRDDHGLYSYGEKEVRSNLEMGAVDILLLSEDLKSKRLTLDCQACGFHAEVTQKEGQTVEDLTCPQCNEKMKISNEEDLIEDLANIAEDLGSSVEIISTETEEGSQLYRAFGGIGAILSSKESEDKKSARIITTNHFQLVDFELNPDANLKVQDKIFIGKDNDIIKQERAQLSYDDLNKKEEFEVEKAIHSIVITDEPKYVKFFNDQSKEASQLHKLDGISRKLGSKILTEKEENGDFESFEDIDNRVRFIESSKDLIVKRVLYELIEEPKIKKGRQVYLFAVVKKSNKKEVPEYDEFVTDDSRFIEMIKEKGLLEKEGKRIR